MAIENKRVIDLANESTSLAGDEYVLLDSNNTGTTKYRLSRLSDQIEDVDEAVQTEATARANAVTAEATARQTADTALEGEITNLKDDLTNIGDDIYEYNTMYPYGTATGWKLNDSDGLCSADANYKVVKYSVTAGDIIKVVSDGRFQFQNSSSVPSSGTSNRIGFTYGTGVYLLAVPSGATFLIVSTPTTSTASVSSTIPVTDGLESSISNTDSVEIYTNDVFSGLTVKASVVNGYWSSVDGSFVESATLNASKKMQIRPNDKISYDTSEITTTTNALFIFWGRDGSYLSYSINRTTVAPANACYVAFNFLASLNLSAVTLTIEKSIIDSINAANRKTDFLVGTIDDHYSYAKLSTTFTDGKRLLANGVVGDLSSTDWKVSDLIDISEYTYIRVRGSSGWWNYIYALYDANQLYISGLASGSDTETFDSVIYVASNVKYIRVAYIKSISGDNNGAYEITGITNRKWVGKKWVCIGDSLTEVNSRTTLHYHDYIAEKTGITVVNMGDSGSGYMHEQDLETAFYQRAVNIPLDADVYTIFGSGNDLSHTLGTPTDTGTDTICGCINETIDVLIGLLPTIQLGIVAPTPWAPYPPDLNDTNVMAQYVKALKEICYLRSIPFLDLYHESNLRPWTAEGRTACYSKDDGGGTHPDEAGHKIIASRFEGFLGSLLLS